MPTIHLIEDDKAVLNALKFAFEIEGFRVNAFCSAKDFLAASWLPSNGCLVIDHYMPCMTGLALLQILRSRGCDLPVILITTRAQGHIQRQAERLHVDYILEKPLSDSLLIEHARQALAPRSRH